MKDEDYYILLLFTRIHLKKQKNENTYGLDFKGVHDLFNEK